VFEMRLALTGKFKEIVHMRCGFDLPPLDMSSVEAIAIANSV
jgi:hypothetical protein